MKRTWIIRYEDELKSIALMNTSIAADGGEAKPKNIFNSQKNVEETMPLKKRLNSYHYEDFQPVKEKKKEPMVADKKNFRPRDSRSSSSDAEKPRFIPAPYEKPVTRRQTKKPAIQHTRTPMPTPKVQTNGKRKRKSGKENQQNPNNNNNQTNKPNNCEPSTSKVEINSSTEPSANEPKEQRRQQQQQQQHKEQKVQVKQKQNELNTTATELKGDDLIALIEMVAKEESFESQAIADMVKSDDGPIDYSMKPTEKTEILIHKKPSPGTSDKKKRKVEPLKIRLVSTSIQGMAL